VYSKVKLAGHPVHPMLVAFPVACYVGTLAAFAVYAANGHLFWLNLAIALSVAGTGTALLAALAGLADWALGIPRDSAAKATGHHRRRVPRLDPGAGLPCRRVPDPRAGTRRARRPAPPAEPAAPSRHLNRTGMQNGQPGKGSHPGTTA
jgi:predicted membrane protein DUF2231